MPGAIAEHTVRSLEDPIMAGAPAATAPAGNDSRRRKRIPMAATVAAMLALVLLSGAGGCGPNRKRASPELRLLAVDDLKSIMSRPREGPALVHVWAMWCPPCREELPTLMRFRDAYAGRGVDLILVSADPPAQKDAVLRYLLERGAAFPSYISENPNSDFINCLCTNWSGALPASFFFGPGGELRQWWEGKAEYGKYAEAAAKLLKQTGERR